jgi:hypothetical protein
VNQNFGRRFFRGRTWSISHRNIIHIPAHTAKLHCYSEFISTYKMINKIAFKFNFIKIKNEIIKIIKKIKRIKTII